MSAFVRFSSMLGGVSRHLVPSRGSRVKAGMLSIALACACAGAPPRPSRYAVGTAVALCVHRVPAETCTRCQPSLATAFRRQGDWCGEHEVPESQCLDCHPGMKFAQLPLLPADADLRVVSPMGEDVPNLAAHLAPGKVTVFEFFAAWCVACRDMDVDLYGRLADGQPLAVRKANVMSWDSPLAARYMDGVASLPYVIVLAPDGRRVGELSGYDAAALERLIAKARL
jgi:thiol-disulfide isomerase/thioredoxin